MDYPSRVHRLDADLWREPSRLGLQVSTGTTTYRPGRFSRAPSDVLPLADPWSSSAIDSYSCNGAVDGAAHLPLIGRSGRQPYNNPEIGQLTDIEPSPPPPPAADPDGRSSTPGCPYPDAQPSAASIRGLIDPHQSLADHYTRQHTRSWSEVAASFDGYVFVIPGCRS
jgi:hypothetical protein